jgi:surface antigen
MTEEDVDLLKQAIASTLDKQPDGSTSRWENSRTGAHGDLTPRATFTDSGLRCRDLEIANSARGRNNRLVLSFCRQADGEWTTKSF